MKEKTPNFIYLFSNSKGYPTNLLLQENLANFVEKGDLFKIYKRYSSSLKRKILKN